jgi:hypothetical protein
MAIPCICCGKSLENVTQLTLGNQPYNGIVCVAYGNYGSRIFDPIGESEILEFSLCDECLILKLDKKLIHKISLQEK